MDMNKAETKMVIIEVDGRSIPRFAVRVHDRTTRIWWYVRDRKNGRYTFTKDPKEAKLFSDLTARTHLGNMISAVQDI